MEASGPVGSAPCYSHSLKLHPFGADLFSGVLDKATNITASDRHPLEFYRRSGFEVVGLIPNANGRGKPDILMSKTIA